MKQETFLKHLNVPAAPIDVVLDTDAYNEIDDQFAISYLLKSDGLNTLALYAAPFFNNNSTSPEDGMERSYDEIGKLLALMGKECPTYRGSRTYLPDEATPVDSPAARDLIARAMAYSPEQPLYVVAIGAITNVASALLMEPAIAEKIVVVWLGGHAHHFHDTTEFNMVQDIAAARVIFDSGVPLIQLPCAGVVSAFTVSKQELEHYLMDKNPLADDLARNTIAAAEEYAAGRDWTRVIWDVTAIAWLTDRSSLLSSTIEHAPIPEYDGHYAMDPTRHFMRYVRCVNRDALMADLIRVICGE